MGGTGGGPNQIVQGPGFVAILQEADNDRRIIPTDGRSQGNIRGWRGESVGRWEGDTLVVETTGLKESIDQPTAHGENARIVERYTPRTVGGVRRLPLTLTIHDPEFYTAPPTVTREYTQLQVGRMLDYDCNEPDWEDHLESLRQKKK